MALKDFISTSIKATTDVTAANQLKSLATTGTAPISVVSTTKVTNLNADLLDGYHADPAATLGTIPVRDGAGALPGDITGNAVTVTNGLYSNGSYSDPSWLISLAWTKVASHPTTLSGYGITDAQASDVNLTAIAALGVGATIGAIRKTAANSWTLDSSTFTETDTLQSVTGRGASSNVATVTLSANTTSTNVSTGTLVITGGVGIGGALNVGGDTIIGGNLTVNGTTITVNSTTVTIDDPIFTLGGDTAPGSDDGKDRGIEFKYYSGSAKVGFFGYDNSTGYYTFLLNATNTSEVFSGTKADIDAGNFRGNLIPNAKISFVAGSGSITGSINIPATSSGNTAISGDLYGSSTGLFWHNGTAVKTIAYLDSTLTGSWNGSVISLAKGGTNADLSAAGAAGGVAYSTGTAISLTGAGSSGQFLKSGVAASPTWAGITESDIADGTLLARVGGNETISGTWSFSNEITNGNTKIYGNITAALANTSQTAVDTNATANVRALKYIIQTQYSTQYQISEIVVIHDGTTATLVEYAVNYTGASPLVTFDADISGGNVRLLATAANASTNLKILRVNIL
jgi:hypothetical protein